VKFSNKSTADPRPTVETGPKLAAARPPDPHDRLDDDALFDFNQLRQSAEFVLDSVRRYRVAALATLVVALGAATATANLWPKSYEADGRLLMQRNELMASLVNPGRTIPREAESPTLAAREIVLGRDNVLALMKATNLLEQWQAARSPLLRLKDGLMRLFRSAPTEDERVDALAGLIEQRLQVGTSDEGAVSFLIRWPDAQIAFRLVDEAMKSFLEYRRVTETAAITESIGILDRSIVDLESQINQTIAQLPRRGSARAVARPIVRPAGPSAETVVQLSRLRSALEARQQDITRMVGIRSQQLSEAQGRLTAALTIYTEDHPTVLGLRQTVAQLSRDSPELVAARSEAADLEAEYDALSVKVGVATEAQSRSIAIAGERSATIDPFSLVTIGDETEPVSLRLRVEMSQLAALRERANAARAELSSAQAGFKYRYSVTRPPRVPRRPSGPNVPVLMLVGAVASMILAIGVPVAMRMRRL
jgi:uncharacterized protein involved in exopolysaccharide biosynthesis